MFRSLRFRLPALFLGGVVASGVVAAAVAFQLLQSYTLQRARGEVRREVTGLTQLYAYQASNSNVDLQGTLIERAIADRLWYVPRIPGAPLFPGAAKILLLPPGIVDLAKVRKRGT